MLDEIIIEIDIRNNEDGLLDIYKKAELQLDEKCDHCSMLHFEDECKYCEGTGYIITDAGEQILSFIERHRKK